LILSGILEEQSQEVVAAVDSSHFYIEDQQVKGDWVALVAKKQG
jgi:ribosomal protein L11 methylase PrmA